MKIRTFYVDAALSKPDQENKRYWRCSVVENNQNVANFTNLAHEEGMGGSMVAESYTIFKVVEWLKEQSWQGQVHIFTDVAGFPSNQYYLNQAQELAYHNNIDLKVKWVKGTQNLADYFSRQNITVDRKEDKRVGRILALLAEPNRLNIILNISLKKIFFSKTINRISKHLFFIQNNKYNNEIDVIWNACELCWALKLLIKNATYIRQEEEKEKLRQFIEDLEAILQEKKD